MPLPKSPYSRGCLFVTALAAVPIGLLLLCAFLYTPIRTSDWSLADQLPETVEVLESFRTHGMDSYHLVKARFSSEDEITQICKKFDLLSDENNPKPLGFGKLFDEEYGIPWFPLTGSTRRYAFYTEIDRYEQILWINDETNELILQLTTF